jgi:hypothetical protein
MENGCDALVSKTDVLGYIMFHHQSKQDALHAFLIDGTGNARPPQTRFFLGYAYRENFLVGRLNCHPMPYRLGTNLKQRFVNDKPINLPFPLGQLPWFVLLYLGPYGDMVSFDKT